MYKLLKKVAALIAAAIIVNLCSISAFADKIKTIDSIKYLCSDSGKIIGKYTGWVKNKNGCKYYYKNGVMLKSKWLKVNGVRTYYLHSNGKMATGDVLFSNGYTYHFNQNGKLAFCLSSFIHNASKDQITQTSLLFMYTGILNNDSKTIVKFDPQTYTIEHKDSKGQWVECNKITTNEQHIEGNTTYKNFFRINGNKVYSNLHTIDVMWEKKYGKLPAGEYRYVNNYIAESSEDNASSFSGKFRFTFEIKENRLFTIAELQTVYDYLREHSKEFDISGIIIDGNRVVADTEKINDALKAYVETLEEGIVFIYYGEYKDD